MATTLTQTHPLLTTPFSSATDFTVLADYCERIAESLTENDDPTIKLALSARLSACLSLLQPMLNEPIARHLTESLTVDSLPANSPYFEPDSEQLCDYCVVLTQLLTERMLSPSREQILTELLCELVYLFTSDLKAPRWVRREGIIQFIS